jgi:hypothetical protein
MHEELLDFLLPKDVRRGALTFPTEDACGWDLVPWILGVHEARKASHRLQPVMALGFRRAQGCPRDRGARDDMGLPTPTREAGELAEIAFDGDQRKASRTT